MAQPLIGFFVHHAVARASGVASRGEVALVHLNVREHDALLDQDIAAGDHQNLPGRHPGEQKHGTAADGRDRRVVLRLFVRHDRRGKPALHRLHAHAREGRAIDPHGAAIQRLSADDRLELDHITVELVYHLRPAQLVAVVGVESKLQRKRQHLLGLQERKRGPVGSPLRAVDRKRQFFPFDVGAADEVTVFRHDVVARIGHRRPEVLLHARIGRVIPNGKILRALLLLMARDDLRDRQRLRRRHVAAIREHLGGALVEIEHHRPARQRHLQTYRPGDVIARVIAGGRSCPFQTDRAQPPCRPSTGSLRPAAVRLSRLPSTRDSVANVRSSKSMRNRCVPVTSLSPIERRSCVRSWRRDARSPTSAAKQSAPAPAALPPRRRPARPEATRRCRDRRAANR